MPRPVILFSGPFADLPLADLAAKAGEWGYAGLELCCWGDHLEVQHALGDADYAAGRLALLGRSRFAVPGAGQPPRRPGRLRPHRRPPPALVARLRLGRRRSRRRPRAGRGRDGRHGAGRPGARATVVSGFTGSPLSSYRRRLAAAGTGSRSSEASATSPTAGNRSSTPAATPAFASPPRSIPGQIAFDLYTAERALEALDGREEFGFLFDPSHLHWQGVDPVAFLRRFPDRILHVHVKDAVLTLDGRTGVLGSLLPAGDPRRGWQPRSPGRGGIDWDAIIRALNDIGYDGPLSVDWSDPGMDRDFGAEDACKFVKQLDVPAPPRSRRAVPRPITSRHGDT